LFVLVDKFGLLENLLMWFQHVFCDIDFLLFVSLSDGLWFMIFFADPGSNGPMWAKVGSAA
jgi:hypothetical protein